MSFSVQVLALAAYPPPSSQIFTLFVFFYMQTRHRQPRTGNETPSPQKNATQVGCLAKALEGRVCLCGTTQEHHLFYCDVHNLNRERSVESEEQVSGEKEKGKDGRREGRRMRERERKIKWGEQSERARGRQICVSVCVSVNAMCVYMGGTNLREEMGALRVLSTPFSSSHSWEIWSTELGGTNTQTQINCCLENKSSFPFISLRCSISPCWSSGSKRCCVNGAHFQTLEHEKFIPWRKKGN